MFTKSIFEKKKKKKYKKKYKIKKLKNDMFLAFCEYVL